MVHVLPGPAVHHISIHAPREGRDYAILQREVAEYEFQSTRPARGATGRQRGELDHHGYFNPRAPRGARPRMLPNLRPLFGISIHAPREGRDPSSSA